MSNSQNSFTLFVNFALQSINKKADFVLENSKGKVIGIEVKSSKTIDKKYLSGLQELKDAFGDKFKKGIVLYLGNEVFPLTYEIWAVPVCYLGE